MSRFDPLVSIIVPIYNCEFYIKECVDSLVNQSYKNLEIILIDDGSKDNSENIIGLNYNTDNRVKYIKKINEGVSKTRNLGIHLSTGDYITFVDGDDYVSYNFIKTALDLLIRYDLDFILGGTQRFTKNERKNYAAKTKNEIIIYDNDLKTLKAKVLSNGTVEDKRLDSCFTSGPVCKLFRSEIIKNVNFMDTLTTGEDTVFNLQVLNITRKAGVAPDIWYYYRLNIKSATNVYNTNIKVQYEKTLDILKQMFISDMYMQPFLKVRAVQQFHGMLILYPMHNASRMTYKQVRRFIKSSLDSEPWKEIFNFYDIVSIPSNGLDKLLYFFCVLHAVDLIYLLVRVRSILKHR